MFKKKVLTTLNLKKKISSPSSTFERSNVPLHYLFSIKTKQYNFCFVYFFFLVWFCGVDILYPSLRLVVAQAVVKRRCFNVILKLPWVITFCCILFFSSYIISISLSSFRRLFFPYSSTHFLFFYISFLLSEINSCGYDILCIYLL